MTIENFFGDIEAGNFTHAFKRIEDFWNTLPAPFRLFVNKLGTDEGIILQNLVNSAIPIITANGFTTAGFVTSGKDILSQLVAQNINTFTLQEIMAALNIAIVPSVPVITSA